MTAFSYGSPLSNWLTVVTCLPYTTPSWPNRNTGLPIVEVSHSWLSCNHVLLLEIPAYPWKCLICRCLVTTAFDQTRHIIIIIIIIIIPRLCSLVVTVPGFRSRGPVFDSGRSEISWEVVGLEWDPISLVRIIEELLEWQVLSPS
jgi:hypothetical protein